jgi:hypothetical protein
MGQKLRDDKIGTLSGGSSITMAASSSSPAYLTLGGQQYRVTSNVSIAVGSPSSNTLYFIYAYLSGGNVALDINSSVPSVYLTANSGRKLVGAFYSTGTASPGFGSFVNITGVPESNFFDYTPTSGWNTNVTHSGSKKRVGDSFEYIMRISVTGTPNANNITFNIPDTMDIAKVPGGGHPYTNFGIVSMQSAGTSYAACMVGVNSSTNLSVWGLRQPAASAHDYTIMTNTIPATFINGDFVQVRVTLPIVGLTNTQLVDL